MKHNLGLSMILAGIFLLAPGFAQAEDLDGGECNEAFAAAEGLTRMNPEKLKKTNADMEDAGDSIPPDTVVWNGTVQIDDDTFEIDYWNDKQGQCQMRMRLISTRELAV